MSALQATRSRGESLKVQLSQRLDVGLVVAVIALLALGLVMVASASISIADKQLGEPLYYFKRQLVFVFAGIGMAVMMYRLRLVHWERSGMALLLFTLFLLALVLIPGVGKTVNGSTRWLPLGVFSLQVSEFAKLCMAIYLAGYLVRRGREVRESFRGFLKPITVLSIASLLLLLEPGQPDGYERDWQPMVFGPERNVGYAVQWFGLAAALTIIYLVVNTRRVN